MRYAKFFGKTHKGGLSGSELISHQYLTRGGFIAESVAGRYYFLPLGWRVHQKIQDIIRQEMNQAGALEMITPTLHPLELWQETNRTSTAGFELMQLQDRRGADFALGGTAEEMFVDLVRSLHLSYRDLPFNIYQFSTKFRDELRARGGLLRLREFVMKDAYSFHTDEKDFEKEYENMTQTYIRIFKRCKLQVIKVLADNGYIGGDYCHEFQVECPQGEGRFFVEENGNAAHEDVAKFNRKEINPQDKILPMKIQKQPRWVCTMEDNIKHYGLPASRFLKNVVYKHTSTGEIFIATIRGDLEVNKTKLEQVLKSVGQLEPATEEDLRALGTKPGYVHSWGHAARYIGDLSLTSVRNFIGGQKEDETDSCNVNYGRDFTCEVLADIAMAYDGAEAEDGGKLSEKKGVEVGNIFQLGLHYTTKMKGANFVDNNGQDKPFYMGCYGLGIGRTMATIAEIHHDQRGIIWPREVAPFHFYLIGIGKSSAVAKETEKIYKKLLAKNIEVLYDDRDEKKAGPGQKFADHELLGIPWRIVISEKTLAKKSVELTDRQTMKTEIISAKNLDKLLEKWLKNDS